MSASVNSPATQSESAPDRVTSRPLIGVIAVMLGAINSVMAGRLLLIGLPDLRGVLGIGIDEASWLPTAFNGAQMFVGPITVAAGAIFGHRKVLLVSGAIFTIASVISPLVPDYNCLIFLQIIRGLSSGTFYPLTISFVLRGLPKAYIPFGIAAYALEILGSTHFAYPLYGFYSEHLSWHWIFWNAAIFTPIMMVCIYFGMPTQKPLCGYKKLHFAGAMYISAGLTFLFVALDQGERTDWFNYGLVNGCVLAGVLLLAFGIYRRITRPSKLFNFGFMMNRNMLFTAYLLTCYRFSILGMFALIPNFLITAHQYRPLELGTLAVETGVVSLIISPLIAVAISHFDVRIIGAVGFALITFALFGDAHILSVWQRNDFIFLQVILAIGTPTVFIGLTATQLFSGLKPGEMPTRISSYTNGFFFQTIRLFGQEAGAALMLRFLLWREHGWRTILVSHVDGGWQTAERLTVLSGALAGGGSGPDQAYGRALRILTKTVEQQAQTLALADGFMILASLTLTCIFITFFLRPIHVPGSKYWTIHG